MGLTILISQIPSALGITITTHDKIYLNIKEILLNIGAIQRLPTVITILGVGLLQLLKKKAPKIPGAIVLSLIGIVMGFLIQHGRFPHMTLLIEKYPQLNFSLRNTNYLNVLTEAFDNSKVFIALLQTSAVIAIITILETIISGKIGEKMTKVPFNKDKEVLGNALANLGSGLMGGMPTTAVFVRTALNIKS